MEFALFAEAALFYGLLQEAQMPEISFGDVPIFQNADTSKPFHQVTKKTNPQSSSNQLIALFPILYYT